MNCYLYSNAHDLVIQYVLSDVQQFQLSYLCRPLVCAFEFFHVHFLNKIQPLRADIEELLFDISRQLLEEVSLPFKPFSFLMYLLPLFNISFFFYTSKAHLKRLLIMLHSHTWMVFHCLCVYRRNRRPAQHLILCLCCARTSLPLVYSIDSFISFAFVPPFFLPSSLPNPFLLF